MDTEIFNFDDDEVESVKEPIVVIVNEDYQRSHRQTNTHARRRIH